MTPYTLEWLRSRSAPMVVEDEEFRFVMLAEAETIIKHLQSQVLLSATIGQLLGISLGAVIVAWLCGVWGNTQTVVSLLVWLVANGLLWTRSGGR